MSDMNWNPAYLQPIIGAIDALRSDLSTRIEAVETRFDTLSETYTTRREHQDLKEQHQQLRSEVGQISEWRIAQMQRQYESLLQVSQRGDAQAMQALRETDRVAQQSQAGGLAAAEQKNQHLLQLNLNMIGWIVAIVLALIALVSAHAGITWH